MRIIVDVMGGDNSPLETVKGACLAAEEFPATYILVGDKDEIERVADENGLDLSDLDIIHTDSVITMEDIPLSVVRDKGKSSMSTGLRMLAEGKGDVFVTAGNTGALYTGATLIVRKIKGINRAALASVLPMENPMLLLDCGANITVDGECLEQFAAMGSAYMKKNCAIESPRVGLLNNGAEPQKGTELHQSAYKLLAERESINFVGNVEADLVPCGVCDVLVTDGFTGNIMLKSVEGMGKLMGDVIRDMYSGRVAKFSALVVKKKLENIKKNFDPGEHGGAPLLGISKPVVKAHGSSDARAFKNAIRQAISYYNSGVIYDIAQVAAEFVERRNPGDSGDADNIENVKEENDQ